MSGRQSVLEQLVEHTSEGFWYIDVDAITLDINPAMCRILGRPTQEVIGRSVFDFVDEDNLAIFRKEIAARKAGIASGSYEIALRRPSGELVTCINNAHSVWSADGTRIGSIGLWTDISKLKRIEAELRQVRASLEERVEERTAELAQNERRLREAHKIARLGSWEVDGHGGLIWSDEVFELFGADPTEFDGTSESFYRHVHPDDRERVREESSYAWEKLDRYETVHRVVTRDGKTKTVRESAAVLRDSEGRAYRLSGTVQDVTDQVATEARLRQAQRMEAIGQLTGGIAHDFNNLLGVIMGSAEFLQMSESYDAELVESILHATKRGAELTSQMLAYARKQPLNASQFSVASLVESKMTLLSRTLGTMISVRLQAADGLWNVLADAGQVEDALLNLVINARHAMRDGGNLIIECFNETVSEHELSEQSSLRPGDYVVLSVSDDGMGMTKDVLEQATDPFFTTKGTEGSGLGLSMVFGFASQSGGHLCIYSELNVGTTVKLYLPRALGGRSEQGLDHADSAPLGNRERILVIEDDPAVRIIVERVLESLNYSYVSTADAQAARAALNSDNSFDLMLSDVVLPNGLSGPELAEQIGVQHPELKVMFMSGYPAAAVGANRKIVSKYRLLRKPFRREEVARALRTVFDV